MLRRAGQTSTTFVLSRQTPVLGRTCGGLGSESREIGREATSSRLACTSAFLENGLAVTYVVGETSESHAVGEVKARARLSGVSAITSCPMGMDVCLSVVPIMRRPIIGAGLTSTACAANFLNGCSPPASVSAPLRVVRNGPASTATGCTGTPAGVAPSRGENGLGAVPCPMVAVSGVVGLMGQVGQETKGLGMLGHTNVVMASEGMGRLEAAN